MRKHGGTRFQYWKLFLAVVSLSGILGCGPMNKAPSSQLTPSNCDGGAADENNMSEVGHATTMSGNHSFIVQARIVNPQGGYLSQPQVGDNQYQIRLLNVETLSPCTSNAQVTLQYNRQRATGNPQPHQAAVTKNADGTFSATLTFKKSGTWVLDIHVVDGVIQDDDVIYATIGS